MTVTRGTTNGAARGNSRDRRARRAWLLKTYASDVPGLTRCYRCGALLYNPDDSVSELFGVVELLESGKAVQQLTVDRIIPGCKGGTYRRSNIRPACGPCNSETGGGLRG